MYILYCSYTQQLSGPLILRLDPALRELNRHQQRGKKNLYWRHCGTVRSRLQAEVAADGWAREFKSHLESRQLALDWSHPDFQGSYCLCDLMSQQNKITDAKLLAWCAEQTIECGGMLFPPSTAPVLWTTGMLTGGHITPSKPCAPGRTLVAIDVSGS